MKDEESLEQPSTLRNVLTTTVGGSIFSDRRRRAWAETRQELEALMGAWPATQRRFFVMGVRYGMRHAMQVMCEDK